jgi:BCCT family betaine/carnitine transporter
LEQGRIDWLSFGTVIVLILVVCLPLAASPEAGGKLIQDCYTFIASTFGVFYLLGVLALFGLLGWLAFGRYGNVKLGDADSKPEFSTWSWIAMLFSAGVGAGLLYWAAIEWGYYYESPPYGVTPKSTAAAEWASSYGLFHWGLSAWAIYCFPTLAIAYPYYVKKIPYLRLSTACHELLGKDAETSYRGRVIDFFFIVSLIGGTGTSLGLSTPMISACIGELLSIETGFHLDVAVVLICVTMFGISVYLGLEKGIKKLSDINMIAALVLLGFILLVGPTIFIVKMSANSLGFMIDNFVRMSTWTDPIESTGFVEDWTIFYWAWWIAYGPFVGLFVTRISMGRTFRQVILGMLAFGSLGGWLFFMILGNYSMYLELNNLLPVLEILNGQGAPQLIVQVLLTLPLKYIVLALFSIVSLIFVATTYDSASYTIASVASYKLSAGDHPARWHRVFWSMALAVLPVTLMFIGGLQIIQSAVLVVSLPILIIGVLMVISLLKSLKSEEA